MDGVSFDDLNEKSTKDKNIVHQKMNLLESLMDEFLHITREETVEKFVVKNARLQSFIGEFNQSDIVKVIRVQPEKEQVSLRSSRSWWFQGKRASPTGRFRKF